MNGIIENFAELKAELEAAGHEFTSETDTEVVPHLIEANYKGDFLAAVRAALKRLHGAYALALFHTDDPELLIGARLNAPLVVGLGDHEYYIASDITAIIPYTKRVLVLGEGEVAAITPLGPEVSTLDGITVKPKLIHVDWDVSQAQKGGFAHFMLKEIHETPEAVANAMRGRLTDDGLVSLREFVAALRALPEQVRELVEREKEIAKIAQRYSAFRNFMYFGRGLSYPVALEGALKLKEISYIHAEATTGGELKHGPIALLDDKFPVIAICTASATKDKMVSNVHEIVARNAPVLALITTGDRSLDGVATDVFEMPAVEEVSAAILNTVMLQLFAYHVAVELGENVDQPRNLAKSVTVE